MCLKLNVTFALLNINLTFVSLFNVGQLNIIRKNSSFKLTLEDGGDFEDAEATDGEHLAEGELHEKHGYAGEQEGYEVGNEEGAAAVLVAQVREAPDVAEADGQTHHR